MVTKGPAAGRGETVVQRVPSFSLATFVGPGASGFAAALGRAQRGLDLSLGHFGT
jgi:hypothetical protein